MLFYMSLTVQSGGWSYTLIERLSFFLEGMKKTVTVCLLADHLSNDESYQSISGV